MTALLHLTAGELLREPGMGFVCLVLHFKDFRWFVTENDRKTKLYLKGNVTNVYRSCKSIMQEQVQFIYLFIFALPFSRIIEKTIS